MPDTGWGAVAPVNGNIYLHRTITTRTPFHPAAGTCRSARLLPHPRLLLLLRLTPGIEASRAPRSSRNPARPMHRNLSDLGPRMVRKRVTINESGQTERSSAEGLSLTSRLSEEFSRHEEETVSELSTFLPLSRRYLPKRLSIASEEEEEGDEIDDVVSTPCNKTDSTASLGSDDVSKLNDDVFPAKEDTFSSCNRVENVLDGKVSTIQSTVSTI